MNNRTGYAWFRAAFDVPAGTAQATLLHQGIDDEGEFFLNGQSVGKHSGWNVGGQVDLSKALKPGRNVLAIRVRNTSGGGGIPAPINIISGANAQDNWHFHPGLADLQETPLIATVTNWKDFLADSGPAGWNAGPDTQRPARAQRSIAPNLPSIRPAPRGCARSSRSAPPGSAPAASGSTATTSAPTRTTGITPPPCTSPNAGSRRAATPS